MCDVNRECTYYIPPEYLGCESLPEGGAKGDEGRSRNDGSNELDADGISMSIEDDRITITMNAMRLATSSLAVLSAFTY